MSETETISFPDFQNTEVSVGDRIAAVFTNASTPELRVGTVVGFTSKKDGYFGHDIDQLEVKWEATSHSWAAPEKSKIEARLKRFLKLN